jgi:catechol 2,3-dioxygenase-like lactoylglutathione lyase family enzyme
MTANTPAKMPLMKMARVILFTAQMDAMSDFYGRILGLKLISEEKGWREFAAGGASIALHSGPASPGSKGPKIAFHSADVAALRETLVSRGAKFGKVRQGEVFTLCDGKDPDGNPVQLSSR